MKTKTIKLDVDRYGIHKLESNGTLMFLTTDWTNEPTGKPGERFSPLYQQYENSRWVPSDIQVGKLAVLCSKTSNKTERAEYFLSLQPDDIKCGIGGNSNHNITRFHGWRGTTNDVSMYAHGRRRILRIRELQNGDIAVTVGDDLTKTEA